MIQSKPFPSSLHLGSPTSSTSVDPTSLLSSLSISGSTPARSRNSIQHHQSFSAQNSQMYTGPNDSGDNAAPQQPFSMLGGQQQDPIDTHTSFFSPANSFPFTSNSHGSINSISHSSASSNSINTSVSSNSYMKNNSIANTNTTQNIPPLISGTSNFFPNQQDDHSNMVPLRVTNLPRDIKEQEFNVLFTFAPEFVYSEIQKSPSTAEDGLPTSVIGIGYFKSLNAATNALNVLTSNPHIFAPKDSQLNNPQNAIKCEILYGLFQDPMRLNAFAHSYPQQSQVQNSVFTKSSSRFVFPSAVSTAGNIMKTQLELPPQATYPEIFGNRDMSSNVFSPSSPRNVFPGNSETDFVTSETGKSLLLESQGTEDEEYNDLVKDPVAWLSKNESNYSSGSSLYQPHQAHSALTNQASSQSQQQRQQPVQSSTKVSSQAKPQQSSPVSQSNQSSPPSTGTAQISTTSKNTRSVTSPNSQGLPATATNNTWVDKRRSSTARNYQNISVSGNNSNIDSSKVVVPYSPTSSGSALQILQSGGRVLPPANPADQNPPCNTLYVGNLPPDTNEEELKEIFSSRIGYKRLSFRTKANGPMCFVEFEDVSYASMALKELYGVGLSNSVKGGIRLSFSKNPLGVRSQPNNGNNNNNGSGNANSGNYINSSSSHHSRIGSQHIGYNGNNQRAGNSYVEGHHQRQQHINENYLNSTK